MILSVAERFSGHYPVTIRWRSEDGQAVLSQAPRPCADRAGARNAQMEHNIAGSCYSFRRAVRLTSHEFRQVVSMPQHRHRRLIVGLSTFALLLACAHAPGTATGSPTAGRSQLPLAPTLLLVSIDGLMPNQVLQAESLGVAVPNLKRLVNEGAYATGVRTVVPSLTYPAHTTILTGTSPAIHGIASNIVFDPLGSNREGWYWYARDIRVTTLWDAAKLGRLVTANICWPVSVGAPIDYNLVQYWRAALPDDAKLYRELSTPGLVDELTTHVGPIPNGYDFSPQADEMRVKYAEYVITEKHPSFTTVYLGSLDAQEHEAGPNGPPALAALEKLDAMVGRLRSAFDRAVPERRTVAVVSDHGFIAYHTEIELGSLLREGHFIELGPENEVVAWKAAAWTAGGTGAIVINPGAGGDVRSSIDKLIIEISGSPDYGVQQVFRGREIVDLQGYRGVDYVIALRPGFKWDEG